jgi:sugar phosphate isomerase/epimerase
LAKCQEHLAWAERIGARCCVNIAGSRHPAQWDGPHPDNFSRETFDLIVETTRKIIDAVRPKRTFYTLETMPWIFPSSPDEYLDLIKAVDRPGFAVHLDPVNMITSPARAYRTGDFIRECFAKLGPHIKSCHAKDIVLRENLTVHLDECRPGTGLLDYPAFIREVARLHPDTTVGLEHLPHAEYAVAAQFIRTIQQQNI